MLRLLLVAALLSGLGCGPRPNPPSIPAPSGGLFDARAADSTGSAASTLRGGDAIAATSVVVTLDTVRVEGQPAPEPGGLRDPRTEPLFVDYASPGEALRLRRAFPWIDLDKVRWRYSPPDSADSSKGR